MFSRPLIAGAVGALLLSLLVGCGADTDGNAVADNSSGLTLTVGQQGAQTGALIDASGVLKGAPYKVKWATFSGPTNVIAGFDSGGVDLGLLGDTSLILNQANSQKSWAKGQAPYQNVATYGSTVAAEYPVFVTLASKKSGITSPSQLRGKKWAYVPGGNTNLTYLLSLKAAGLTPKDIKPVVLQDFTALGTALANNQVDVASLPTANAQDALASGAKIIYKGAQIGVPGINTWAVPKSVLADSKKSAAISDLLTRLVAYWDWYAKNPEKVAHTLVSKVKQSPKLAKYNAAAGRSRFFPIDQALFDIEQPVAEALNAGGLIKKSVDVTLEYDDRFNEAILAAAKKQGTPTGSAVLQK